MRRSLVEHSSIVKKYLIERLLIECPKCDESNLRNAEGILVVNCSICVFGNNGGRECSLRPILERACGENNQSKKTA